MKPRQSETQGERMEDQILHIARDKGAYYPTFAESSDEEDILVVDTESGRVWQVVLRLRELKGQ